MSNRLTEFRDTLFDLISGLGTPKDPTTRAQFHLRLLNRNEVENAYRSDWVARKIIDIPAEDATKEWRSWQADPKAIQAIEACEELHALQKKLRMALIRARLYGGAALVFAVKGQDPATEMDMESIGKGDLEFVVVMNRYELMAGPRIFNVQSPYYTRPEYYTVATPVFGVLGEKGQAYPLATDPLPAVIPKDKARQQTPPTGTVTVHPSRVIEFSGNELPDWRLVPMGGGWGDSVLQTVDDVLKDIGLTISGIANMVNDAKVDIIRIPDFSKQIATTEYANRLLARFAYANQAKSTVNSLLLDTNEEWERVQTRFQGLPNIIHEYLLLAGGAAGIPMSILVGQSGSRGMGEGSTSTGGEAGGGADVRNYYDRIMSQQETIYGPAMAPLDQVIVRSALGRWSPDITYNWNPLYQDDASTIAAVETAKANAMKIHVENGLINEDVLRQVQVNMLTDNEEFWIGVEDAVEEYGAEPEEPDIQVPWSRLAGAMASLAGGGGGGNGNGSGGGRGNGGGPNGGGSDRGANSNLGGGKPDILGALGAKLAPPKLPNMRVTSDADLADDKDELGHGSYPRGVSAARRTDEIREHSPLTGIRAVDKLSPKNGRPSEYKYEGKAAGGLHLFSERGSKEIFAETKSPPDTWHLRMGGRFFRFVRKQANDAAIVDDAIIIDAAAKVSKDSVNYRPATDDPSERCGTCSMFEPPMSCSHVAGHIHRPDTCDDWEGKESDAADASPDMRTFQLIRHGATSLNNDDVSVDRIRGWQDVPLSKEGRTEAHKIGRQMAKDEPPDAIYTSDLARSADTAKIIAKHCNAPKPVETRGLRPWDLGHFAGKTTKQVMPEITTLACENSDKKAPGGESFDSFKSRAFKGLHDVLNGEKPSNRVAIVTHHRVERLLKAWKAKGFPADGSIDDGEFNKRGEPTGHAEDFDVPMERLKKAAS